MGKLIKQEVLWNLPLIRRDPKYFKVGMPITTPQNAMDAFPEGFLNSLPGYISAGIYQDQFSWSQGDFIFPTVSGIVSKNKLGFYLLEALNPDNYYNLDFTNYNISVEAQWNFFRVNDLVDAGFGDGQFYASQTYLAPVQSNMQSGYPLYGLTDIYSYEFFETYWIVGSTKDGIVNIDFPIKYPITPVGAASLITDPIIFYNADSSTVQWPGLKALQTILNSDPTAVTLFQVLEYGTPIIWSGYTESYPIPGIATVGGHNYQVVLLKSADPLLFRETYGVTYVSSGTLVPPPPPLEP